TAIATRPIAKAKRFIAHSLCRSLRARISSFRKPRSGCPQSIVTIWAEPSRPVTFRARGLTPAPRNDGGEPKRGLSRRCQIAKAQKVLFLLGVARRQLEQPRRGATENIVLGLFRQERQVPDRRRQVEVPVRIVRGIEKLRLRIHHAERALHRLVIL